MTDEEMTDEEMAEEYADRTRIVDENTRAGTDCISLVQDYEGNYIDIHERIKQAYLAGLGKVKKTERGWAGHFCCAKMCRFRRNTLLEYNGKAVVVSTVGAMYNNKGELEKIGFNRHYETMAFYADGSEYKDANVSEQIYFDSPWQLKWHKDGYIDNEANAMHEKAVEEISKNLLKGVL